MEPSGFSGPVMGLLYFYLHFYGFLCFESHSLCWQIAEFLVGKNALVPARSQVQRFHSLLELLIVGMSVSDDSDSSKTDRCTRRDGK